MTDIAERRSDLLISQTDFGRLAAGVKQTSVSRWERGKHIEQSDMLDNVLDSAEAKRRALTRRPITGSVSRIIAQSSPMPCIASFTTRYTT